MPPQTTIDGRKVALTAELAQLIADEIVLASTGERVTRDGRSNGQLTPSEALDAALGLLDAHFADRGEGEHWLVTPCPDLDRAPVDAISAGHHEEVLEVIRRCFSRDGVDG